MPRLPLTLRPLFALLWMAGSLSLPAAWRLGGWLGRLPRWLGTREARVAQRNVRLCFPQLDAAAQERLRRQCLQETARTLLETFRLWTRPAERTLPWIVEVEGLARVTAARRDGRGLIVAAPHAGNWELLNQYLATLGPLAIVYRAPELRFLEPLLLRGRGGERIRQLRAEPGSVRAMLKHLRGGGILGILPDQRPRQGEGEFAPFFGHPARTMTLLPRLAQSAAVDVVFAFAERLPGGAGFRIRFLPAPPGLDDPDPAQAAAALNRGIEACARLAPAQYQWTYKRFPRALPDAPPGHGGPDRPSSPA